MADMFRSEDVERLMMNKNILFIGDSNIRTLYKDFVWLLKNHSLTPPLMLKAKLEGSFAGDKIVAGSKLHRGRDFTEVRSYQHEKGNSATLVEYAYTSLCYSADVISIFNDINAGILDFDVIVMNSVVTDLSRWGPRCIDLFKENLVSLMKLISRTLPSKCLFLWLTALPVSLNKICSSLLVKELKFLERCLPFNVMEANCFARQVVSHFGHDVLDFHYYCRMQLYHMCKDGIHFVNVLMRYMTNLLLTHISLSWNVPLPGNLHNRLLDKSLQISFVEDTYTNRNDVEAMLKKIESMAPNKPPTKPVNSRKASAARGMSRPARRMSRPGCGVSRPTRGISKPARARKPYPVKQWFPPRPVPYQNNFKRNTRYTYHRNA